MWPAWLTLSPQELWLLLIAGVGLTLIVTNRLRPDLVALLVLLGLGISQVLTPQQALSGFSASAVITIVGLFVITSALEQTGAVQWLADRLARLSGTYEGRVVAVFMGAGALLSLVMNNIAAGAVLLPAAVRVSRVVGVAPSRVLIPLAFGTLLGGMATLFTTANIILSGSLVAQGQRDARLPARRRGDGADRHGLHAAARSAAAARPRVGSPCGPGPPRSQRHLPARRANLGAQAPPGLPTGGSHPR
jgi:hypothetical protein